MAESTGDGGGPESVQFLAPISGLLAIVFAVMAGASLSYALSRPPEMLIVPAVLAAASVGCIFLKRRLEAEPTDVDGNGDGLGDGDQGE